MEWVFPLQNAPPAFRNGQTLQRIWGKVKEILLAKGLTGGHFGQLVSA